ncbi:MAG: MgtC/SapB family protein [Planctomycetaceae bacterium]
MDPLPIFRNLMIALLLGLLVGLQRERTDSKLAGFRTFPLATVFGTMCAVLAQQFEFPWIIAAGLLAVVAVILAGHLHFPPDAEPDRGVTSEVALVLMYVVGAFVAVGPWSVAAAVAGGTAILLQMKPQMHGFARRMGEQDFRGVLQFVLVTFIILPILPNENYDPLEIASPVISAVFPDAELPSLAVLNPYEIWLLVVLVVSISLGGYVAYKLFGQRAGTVLGGVLGGVISSTATTVSYSRRTSEAPAMAGLSAIVLMIASSIVFVRVLLEIAVVAPPFLLQAGGPILTLFAVAVALSVLAWLLWGGERPDMPEQTNPTELRSAVVFASVYAVVIVAVAAGQAFLGEGQLYGIAVLSGMTDMDAITLSTARLVRSERLDPDVGWRLIVVATMSNLAFKAGIVAVLGPRRLLRLIAALFGTTILAGGVLLWLW